MKGEKCSVEPMRMGLPLIVSALSILGVGNNPAMEEAWNLIKERKKMKRQTVFGGYIKETTS